MKEPSIEEKAKAYDRALEAVKRLLEVNPSDEGIQNWVNENFPELCESKDERIRKALIEHFRWNVQQILNDFDNKEVLAWLEKQGEQKTTEWSEEDAKHFLRCLGYIEAYVEPRKDDVRWFKELKDRVQPKNVEWSEADEFIRLTLLKIVKNEMKQHGNVGLGNGIITSDIIVWLKKLGKQKSLDEVAKEITKNKETAISFLKSCGIMNDNGELADEYKTEQCEKKSAENVELKFKVGDLIKLSKEPKYPAREIISIKNDGYYFDSAVYLPFERQDDWELVDTIQNPTWNKEDEYNYEIVMYCLNNQCVGAKDKENAMSWFKSLKERIQPQQEWSVEDDRNLSIAIQYVFQRGYLSTVNWLKSLKERYTWKPSEYQLNSLQVAINIIGEQTLTGTDLKELLEQLNKL